MTKRIMAVALGVVLAGAVTAVAAEPALADTTCGNGLGCTWSGINHTGAKLTYSYSGFGGTGACSQVNQNVESAYQTFGNPVLAMVLFSSSDCTGSGLWIGYSSDVEINGGFFAEHSAILVHN